MDLRRKLRFIFLSQLILAGFLFTLSVYNFNQNSISTTDNTVISDNTPKDNTVIDEKKSEAFYDNQLANNTPPKSAELVVNDNAKSDLVIDNNSNNNLINPNPVIDSVNNPPANTNQPANNSSTSNNQNLNNQDSQLPISKDEAVYHLAAANPNPYISNDASSTFNLEQGQEKTITFTVGNNGGAAGETYFDISFSEGLSCDYLTTPSGISGSWSNYPPGSLIWHINGQQFYSTYHLKSFYASSFPTTSGKTFVMKFKAKSGYSGSHWIKYRASMKNSSGTGDYFRDPRQTSSVDTDQQSYKVWKNTVNITQPVSKGKLYYKVTNSDDDNYAYVYRDIDGAGYNGYITVDSGSAVSSIDIEVSPNQNHTVTIKWTDLDTNETYNKNLTKYVATGARVEYAFTIDQHLPPNHEPSLTTPTVSSATVNYGATVNFDVYYQDLDGDWPSSIQVQLDGSGGQYAHNMTLVSGVPNSSPGALYRYSTSGLSVGNHSFYITASDGEGGLASSSLINQPTVVSNNHAPTYSGPSYTPNLRDLYNDTQITFKITYYDIDNDPPAADKHHIKIDSGSWIAMQKSNILDNTYWDGVEYYYTTTLFRGNHGYEMKFNDGQAGGHSDIPQASFVGPNIVNRPPNIPSNGIPNNVTLAGIIATLSWQCSDPDGDSVGYTLYFGTTSNPPGYMSIIPGTTTVNINNLQANTQYYWRLDAVDTYNSATTAGPIWTFTTGKPNAIPTLSSTNVSPTSGNIDTNFTFKTTYFDTDNDAPTKYQISIDGGSAINMSKSNPLDNNYIDGVEYYYTTKLARGIHSYEVRFNDGKESHSDIISGSSGIPQVNNRVPVFNDQISPTPAVNAVDIAKNLTSSWAEIFSDPDGDPLTYNVYLGEDKNNLIKQSNCSNISGTDCLINSLNYGSNYYWKVEAQDNLSGSVNSNIWSFSTVASSGDIEKLSTLDGILSSENQNEIINGVVNWIKNTPVINFLYWLSPIDWFGTTHENIFYGNATMGGNIKYYALTVSNTGKTTSNYSFAIDNNNFEIIEMPETVKSLELHSKETKKVAIAVRAKDSIPLGNMSFHIELKSQSGEIVDYLSYDVRVFDVVNYTAAIFENTSLSCVGQELQDFVNSLVYVGGVVVDLGYTETLPITDPGEYLTRKTEQGEFVSGVFQNITTDPGAFGGAVLDAVILDGWRNMTAADSPHCARLRGTIDVALTATMIFDGGAAVAPKVKSALGGFKIVSETVKGDKYIIEVGKADGKVGKVFEEVQKSGKLTVTRKEAGALFETLANKGKIDLLKTLSEDENTIKYLNRGDKKGIEFFSKYTDDGYKIFQIYGEDGSEYVMKFGDKYPELITKINQIDNNKAKTFLSNFISRNLNTKESEKIAKFLVNPVYTDILKPGIMEDLFKIQKYSEGKENLLGDLDKLFSDIATNNDIDNIGHVVEAQKIAKFIDYGANVKRFSYIVKHPVTGEWVVEIDLIVESGGKNIAYELKKEGSNIYNSKIQEKIDKFKRLKDENIIVDGMEMQELRFDISEKTINNPKVLKVLNDANGLSVYDNVLKSNVWLLNTANLEKKSHIVAWLWLGNEFANIDEIIEDLSVPIITTHNGQNFTTDNQNLFLEGTTDPKSVNIYINSSTDGVNYTSGQTNWSFSKTFDKGTYTFNITAKNAEGYESSSASIIVVIDPPPVILTNGGKDFSTNNSHLTLTGTAETFFSHVLVNGSASGVNYNQTTGNWTYNTILENGQNQFSVTAKTIGGVESDSSAIKITLDTIKPTITSSTNGGMFNSTQNVTLSSNESGAKIYYTTDGGEPNITSKIYNKPLQMLKSAKLKIAAIDLAGNVSITKVLDFGIPSYKIQLPNSKWKSFSVNSEIFDIEQAFGQADIRQFNQTTGQYEKVINKLLPGIGYWIKSTTEQEIEIPVGDFDQTQSVAYNQGFGLVSGYFLKYSDQLKFNDGATTKTLLEAINAGWIKYMAYYYDNDTYTGLDLRSMTSDDVLGRSFWLRFYKPLTISFDGSWQSPPQNLVKEIPKLP